RIVQVCKAGVIQLEVSASASVQLLDLFRIDAGQIAPELFDVRIDARINRSLPTAVVHHARRGDAYLRDDPRHGFEKIEVIAKNAVLEFELGIYSERRRGKLDGPAFIVKLHLELILAARDAANLIQEVHVPGGPPKFPIGNDAQSDLLLARHRTSDRV